MLNQNLLLTGDDGYSLSKSLRFRSSASAYLNRTPASTTNRQIFTLSDWVKRGALSSRQHIFVSANPVVNSGGQQEFQVVFDSSDKIQITGGVSGVSLDFDVVTTQVFRDPSSWYHVVVAVDTTQATASNRIKLYVNGVQVTAFSTSTYPTQNYNTSVNLINFSHRFGGSGTAYLDGYMTEVNFIDGQALTPSSFGSTNALTGVWQPAKYTGTYGTNGFYLPFTDNSATTPVGLGKDFSGNTGTTVVGTTTSGSNSMTVVSLTGIAVGNTVTGLGIPTGTYVTAASVLTVTLSQNATSSNVSQNYNFAGNNWTCNNISLTAGSTYDSMTDVPTLTSATTANYCVLNPLNAIGSTATFSNANLTLVLPDGSVARTAFATMGVSSGKWYWESTIGTTGGTYYPAVGVNTNTSASPLNQSGADATGYMYMINGQKFNSGSLTSYGSSYTTNDVIGVALDMDAGTITFYKNNTSQGQAFSGLSGTAVPCFIGQVSVGLSVNFGQRPFAYTPPTGFVALNTYNLPTSTIVKGNTVMDATLYTGNGTNQTITNASAFKPDLVWVKCRSLGYSNYLEDSVRGVGKDLSSNGTGAEATFNLLTSFNSNGFTVSTSSGTYLASNDSGQTFVGWQWQAGQGTNTTNTSGSITSTVSANPTAGFSVVTYTGTGSNATVGHGLGVAPSMIIAKKRSSTGSWQVYHSAISGMAGGYLTLNGTSGFTGGNSTIWNNTAPTSSVFSLGTDTDANANGATTVAYCWSEIAGFSKFGRYTGNGSSDGSYIHLGFSPKFVMIKRTDSSDDWILLDTSRSTYNVSSLTLYANGSYAEDSNVTNRSLDFLSNGFKIRSSGVYINASGGNFIYMAFASNPAKYSLAK